MLFTVRAAQTVRTQAVDRAVQEALTARKDEAATDEPDTVYADTGEADTRGPRPDR
jgi:hypothetical protein